ncbi:hypothetical protein FZ983_30380 [Azospirillum sp. B21]|uniref:hypothetical protein n=1 Tax=Azospirillum sp. B21 TaxID=2607496 RepID=UPI0011EC588E|nr:hypothetical protein [Azospirillum sp. B21]KAA0573323.1 hypothetical protein FZ983_30380 [Azospirillum sp. B21]
MTTFNADRFAKVLALASSDHDGEALAALRKARDMLKAAGKTFSDVIAEEAPVVVYAQPTAPTFTDIFTGFEDRMEEMEPGWKAKRAAEQAERTRKRAAYRKAVIEKYGSAEAAVAPCWREQKVRAALGSLITPCEQPWARWTHHIENIGHCGDFFGFKEVSQQVRAAIETAYTLPTTIQDAHAEYEAWREREREIEAAENWQTGDTALDLAAYGRMERVRMLLETELPARDLSDLLFRSRYYRALECQDDRIEAAIHRDLESLVMHAPHATSVGAPPSRRPRKTKPKAATAPADPRQRDLFPENGATP